MKKLSTILTDFDSAVERITGKTVDEWTVEKENEFSRARTMGNIARGRLHTTQEMFGVFDREGNRVRPGWVTLFGLGMDDVIAIEVDVQFADLTSREKFIQEKARPTSKGDSAFRQIKRAIRYQIADRLFTARH